MKRFSFLLSFLLFAAILAAQLKPLPACLSVATEIATINASFDEMLLNAKKITKYPQMTICGTPGMFETVEGELYFTFKFSEDNYTGKKAAFDAVFEKIYQGLKTTLSSSHDISSDSSAEGRSYHFYEKGKPWQEARMNAHVYIRYESLSVPDFEVELLFNAKLK